MFRPFVLCALSVLICVSVDAQSWQLPPDAQKIVEKAKLGKPLTPKEMARLKQALEAAQKQALQNAAKGATPSTPKNTPGAKDGDPRLKCTVIVDYNLKLEKPQEGQTCDGKRTEKWTQITRINGGFSTKGQLRRFQPGGLQGDETILIGLDGGAQGSGMTTATGGGLHKADTAGTSWTMGKVQGVLTLRAFPSRGDRMTGEFGFQPTINGRAWAKDGCTGEESKETFDVPEPVGAVNNFLPSYAKEQFDTKSNIDYVAQAQAMAKKFGYKVPPLSAQQKAQMAQMAQGWKKWNDERLCDWGISRDAFRKGFVSGQPFRVTGTGQGTKKLQDGTKISGRLSLTVLVGEVPEVELVVKPQNYQTWRPQGGANEKTPGNHLGIEAAILTKDGKAPPALIKAKEWKFELVEVSQEPGVCLNWPQQNATTDADLQFLAANNPGKTIQDPKTLLHTKPDNSVSCVLSSFDWGAWGKLKVTAKLEDGDELVGYLAGQKGTTEILLPKRDKDSKIAEAWKKKAFAKNAPDDQSDDETSPGNTNNGDGLTFYEEYRGLMAKGQHKSLDPSRKEIIVENAFGNLPDAAFKLFESASQILPVQVAPGELNDTPRYDRQVNTNSQNAKRGNQYGLRLATGANNQGVYGKAIHVDDPSGAKDIPMKSPIECFELRLDATAVAALQDPTVLPVSRRQLQEMMRWNIAHEMAHGIAVQHHGLHHFNVNVKLGTGSTHEAYDEKGNLIAKPQTGLVLTGEAGEAGGDASGDVACIMTYNGLYDWIKVPGGGTVSYYKIGTLPYGTIFCTSNVGTGRNANGKLFGNATAGNCLKQFQVRDW